MARGFGSRPLPEQLGLVPLLCALCGCNRPLLLCCPSLLPSLRVSLPRRSSRVLSCSIGSLPRRLCCTLRSGLRPGSSSLRPLTLLVAKTLLPFCALGRRFGLLPLPLLARQTGCSRGLRLGCAGAILSSSAGRRLAALTELATPPVDGQTARVQLSKPGLLDEARARVGHELVASEQSVDSPELSRRRGCKWRCRRARA